MTFPESIFRAYDIRGVIDQEISADTMYQIGRAFVHTFNATDVVVARDARPSSEQFLPHFIRGVISQGANVVNLDLCPNEVALCYAATNNIEHSAIITASHNPAEYVGVKLYTQKTVQVAALNYQAKLKEAVMAGEYPDVETKGTETTTDPWPDYIAKIKSLMGDITFSPRHVLADAGNGVGGMIMQHLAPIFNLTYDELFFEPDGTYPNHVPNPILKINQQDAINKAKAGNYDMTIMFDGDADRVCFLDEHGDYVYSDIVGTLIADDIIHPTYPNAPIVIDIRRGWITETAAKNHGYKVIKAIAGNPYLKKEMREHDGAYGFEASAHNFYKDFFYSDTSGVTLLYLLQVMEKQGKTLNQVAQPYMDWNLRQIFETNYEHHKFADAFEAVQKAFPDVTVQKIDGLGLEADDWHLSLRASNTEPLIRLNVEAKSQETLDSIVHKVDEVIQSSGGKLVDH